MKALVRWTVGAVGACAVAACGAAPGEFVCAPLVDGVDIVANDAGQGIWEREGRTIRFQELWRRGGLRDGEDLAYPVGVVAAPDGRVAIADFQLGEVVVVEPNGEWRTGWGRRGDGPGEVQRPVAVSWGADGDLYVFDVAGAKVVRLRERWPWGDDIPVDPDFLARTLNAGELPWAGVQPGGAVVLRLPPSVPEGASPDADRRDVRIVRLAAGMPAEQAETIADISVPVAVAADPPGLYLPVPGWARPTAAVGTDGQLFVGGYDQSYRVLVFDTAGRPVRQLCRDRLGIPLRPDERGRDLPEPYDRLANEIAAASPQPESIAAIGRLVPGARGRLWVQRHRPDVTPTVGGMYGFPGAMYEVFDPDGRYLGIVRAPDGARIQTAAGDTVWAFEIGQYDEVSLVAYRLVVE